MSRLWPSGEESGATLVFVSIMITLLMGLSAVAVDLGLAFAEKRTDQIGADTAVMAGAIELVQGGQIDDVVAVITAYVDNNIRDLEAGDWEACSDSGALPLTAKDLGATVQTDCISFDTFSNVRVRIPDQDVDTTFGEILGFDLIQVAAAAEALGHQFTTVGTPPPFALLAGFGGGDVVCLRTNAAGNPPPMMQGNGAGNPASRGTEPDPCDDTAYSVDTETFGLLDPYAYFDDDGTIACKQNVNDYFIAAGIDHPVTSYLARYGSRYSLDDDELEDGTGCGGNPKSPINGPNTFAIKTGLTAQELRCGMLTLRSGQCATTISGPPGTSLSSPARLHLGEYYQTTYQFIGENMDNAALWQFFTGVDTDDDGLTDIVGFTNAPISCQTFGMAINNDFPGDWDYYDKRDALLQCMRDWMTGDYDPIFTGNLWHSGRFTFIPELAENTLDSAAGPPNGPGPCPNSGGSCVHIDDLVPGWLQTLYTQSPTSDCDDLFSSGPDTWGMHHAGEETSCGAANGNLVRLSAIVIDCGMIPQDLCDARPGPEPGGAVIPRFELTK